jgi:hypothetical protein
MKKSLHEILMLMKIDVQSDEFCNGLCRVLMSLHMNGLISLKEYSYVKSYLHRNVPNTARVINEGSTFSYWWQSGYAEPRLEWLNHHLSINKPR